LLQTTTELVIECITLKDIDSKKIVNGNINVFHQFDSPQDNMDGHFYVHQTLHLLRNNEDIV